MDNSGKDPSPMDIMLSVHIWNIQLFELVVGGIDHFMLIVDIDKDMYIFK